MLKIGSHLSVSKGLYNAVLDAVPINANSLQFFTKNPRGGRAKDLGGYKKEIKILRGKYQ